MAIICIPLAIVGARLYYVIFDIIGAGGKWTFGEIIGLGGGGLQGLAIYGGLIGAFGGGVIIHFWKHKKPEKDRVTLMQAADLGFVFIILGQAIGRWGNFANQEAYGPKVDFSFFPITVKITNGIDGTGNYLATFFYESLWNLIGFGLLFWLYNGKRKSFDGFITSCYCIYYGIGRMWIESLRTDPLYLAGNVRVSQVVSGLIIAIGAIYIIAHLYFAREHKLKPFILIDGARLNETYYGYKESILSHPNDYTVKPVKEAETDYSDEFYSEADDGFYEPDAPESDVESEGVQEEFDEPADGGDA
jgi:prolipoprotein diacylglyceryl transferase